jgi:hypothetical protein
MRTPCRCGAGRRNSALHAGFPVDAVNVDGVTGDDVVNEVNDLKGRAEWASDASGSWFAEVISRLA